MKKHIIGRLNAGEEIALDKLKAQFRLDYAFKTATIEELLADMQLVGLIRIEDNNILKATTDDTTNEVSA